MKFTLSWLKDHLETDATLDEITAALTSIGLEVEGIENSGKALAAFTVCKVKEARPHPAGRDTTSEHRVVPSADGRKARRRAAARRRPPACTGLRQHLPPRHVELGPAAGLRAGGA